MRIENNPGGAPIDNLKGTADPAGTDKKVAAAKATTVDSVYSADPRLAALVALVQQDPAVRPEALARVVKRLDRGEYLTPESAQQTVAAILGTP